MNKRIRNVIILFAIILGIPLALYLETQISVEIRTQNLINVEKTSPPIEITGVIDYERAFDGTFVYLVPDSDDMYKIEETGVDKAYLQYSFIDRSTWIITQDFDGKKVRISGVLVNDNPQYGKPEKTYDAIIIVQNVEVLN